MKILDVSQPSSGGSSASRFESVKALAIPIAGAGRAPLGNGKSSSLEHPLADA